MCRYYSSHDNYCAFLINKYNNSSRNKMKMNCKTMIFILKKSNTFLKVKILFQKNYIAHQILNRKPLTLPV